MKAIVIIGKILAGSTIWRMYEGTFVGFGDWVRIVFYTILVMVAIGLVRGRVRILSDFWHNILIAGVSGISTILLAKALFAEVANSAIKWFDLNCLVPGDSPAWSVIIVIPTLTFLALIFGIAIFYASWFIGERKNFSVKN